jgi:hypothetical protein
MDNYEALPDGSHIASTIEDYDGATVYLLFAFDELFDKSLRLRAGRNGA